MSIINTIEAAIQNEIEALVERTVEKAVSDAFDGLDFTASIERTVEQEAERAVEAAMDDVDFDRKVEDALDDVDFDELAEAAIRRVDLTDAVQEYLCDDSFTRLVKAEVRDAVSDLFAGGPSDEVVALREQVQNLTDRLALIERWAASAANLIVQR